MAFDEPKEHDQLSDVDCANGSDNNDVDESSSKEQISESEEVLMESAQESPVSDHSKSPYSDHNAPSEENEIIDVKNDDMQMSVDNDNHSECLEDDVKSPIQTLDINDEPIQDNISVESSNEWKHSQNDGMLCSFMHFDVFTIYTCWIKELVWPNFIYASFS